MYNRIDMPCMDCVRRGKADESKQCSMCLYDAMVNDEVGTYYVRGDCNNCRYSCSDPAISPCEKCAEERLINGTIEYPYWKEVKCYDHIVQRYAGKWKEFARRSKAVLANKGRKPLHM